ncbi:MAG: hypothetical protein EOO92_25355, partial [Pedobacter sp.]
MKNLRELQGGYPRQQDYLLTLQNELMTVANSLFGKLNHDMVLKGCDITDNLNGTVNIAEGIVFIGNEALRFDGANNVPSDGSMAMIKGSAATSSPKLFADGQTRDVYTETKALIGSYSALSQIKIGLSLYTLATYIEDVTSSYAIKGELKDIYDYDGTFLANFDGDGNGITPRYSNWSLFKDGEGRVRVTVGSTVHPLTGEVTTFAHGEKGGEVKHQLTVGEMPAHNHGAPLPNATNDSGTGAYDAGSGNG